jgi:hypothetical protein
MVEFDIDIRRNEWVVSLSYRSRCSNGCWRCNGGSGGEEKGGDGGQSREKHDC